MNNVEVKSGQLAVAGYVGGVWDKESKSFEVKRGMGQSGKKYQIFEIKVSEKKEDGSYVNGKGLKVMLFGDKPINNGDSIGVSGKLVPDNWTNQEGKEIRGMMMMAFETFEPASWDAKPKKEAEPEDSVW